MRKSLRLFYPIERHASPALLEEGAIVPANAARSLFPQDDGSGSGRFVSHTGNSSDLRLNF